MYAYAGAKAVTTLVLYVRSRAWSGVGGTIISDA